VQLIVQLRSVFAEYGLSGTNIAGRHCDTVMPSTTTARRANTRIEAHTYRARISPPGLKDPHRAKHTSNTRHCRFWLGRVIIPVQSRPRLPELSHWIAEPCGYVLPPSGVGGSLRSPPHDRLILTTADESKPRASRRRGPSV
jgi:hypothetical protein